MRTLLALLVMFTVTPFWAGRVVIAGLLGVPDGEGSIYRRALHVWGRAMCWAAGARVIVHDGDRLRDGTPRILVANHVSWFDVFALAAVLPDFVFVAKAEIERIPILGRAARAAGHVYIKRTSRKAAFAAYEEAARRIHTGTAVVVFPEGTRGRAYPLRPFKKGPFVLAIAAQAPLVPMLVHGSLEVLRKGSIRVRANEIHIHVLDDVPTAGLTYDDRDALARQVYTAMRSAQFERYGIASPPWPAGTAGAAARGAD
jgi:1-acyl-sn-glycerol-3-phosphate acyltransferase